MLQRHLNRAVARATGDSLTTIRRLGFQLAGACRELGDMDDLSQGPLILDWDALESVPLAQLVSEACYGAA